MQPKKVKGFTKISHQILSVIEHELNPTTQEVVSHAREHNIEDFVVKAELLKLENGGFIARSIFDQNDPLNNSSWRLTQQGSEKLREDPLIARDLASDASDQVPLKEEVSGVQIVMTCPADFRQQFVNLATEESVDILKKLFVEASIEMRLVSPYVDNVIVDRFEDELQSLAKRGIKLKLIFRDYNPQTQNVIQWLKVVFGENFAYRRIWTPLAGGRGQSARGVHAKFLIIDNRTALVSSMNLTVNSINYNIEMGVLIKDKISVEKVRRIFDILWNNAGSTVTV